MGGAGGADADACADGGCGPTCGDDYEPIGGECVLTKLFVDAALGNDAWIGDSRYPLKTYSRAMEKVAANPSIRVVNFNAGNYGGQIDAGAAGSFDREIPAGVTVQLKPGEPAGSVVFRADQGGSAWLRIGAGAVVDGIKIIGFDVPLAVEAGTATVKNISVLGQRGPVTVTKTGTLVCTNCLFEGNGSGLSAGSRGGFFEVDQGATLIMHHGTIDLSRLTECPTYALHVTGSGNLTLDGVYVFGKFYVGLFVDAQDPNTGGTIELLNNTIFEDDGGCSSTSFRAYTTPVYMPEVPYVSKLTINVDNARFFGPVELGGTPVSVKARRSVFAGATGLTIALCARSVVDLGRYQVDPPVSDPGRNEFNGPAHVTGLYVENCGTNFIYASGNFWVPLKQNADGRGEYPPGTVMSHLEYDPELVNLMILGGATAKL